MAVVHPVVDQLEKHIAALADGTHLAEARQEFLERGAVRVPFLVPDSVKRLLAVEVEELVTAHGCHRELISPRRPYEPEQFVITALDQDGDTHGWHWDDYSFALVWIIDCPPVAYGGFVQCVPHTEWDKNDPRLHKWLSRARSTLLNSSRVTCT
jgi:hypothetical protein